MKEINELEKLVPPQSTMTVQISVLA